MDVTILNTNLDAVSIVDTYESFIWTDRYYAYGDFELYEAMRELCLKWIRERPSEQMTSKSLKEPQHRIQ